MSIQPGEAAPLDQWEGIDSRGLQRLWRVPAVHVFSVIDSTNEAARRLAGEGAESGTIVLAEEQLAGRGRLGRTWLSPPGSGLWFSMILRPAAAAVPTGLPVRIALAVARSLDAWLDEPARIKWPNDVLLGAAKLGGILCEASWEAGRPRHVVAGVGLNIFQRADDFPAEFRASATSLRIASSTDINRLDVATAIMGELRSVRDQVGEPLSGRVLAEVAARDALLGTPLEVIEPQSGRLIVRGLGGGITSDGSLRVASEKGEVTVRSGTVRRITPPDSGASHTGKPTS